VEPVESPPAPRDGSKQALVIALLRRGEGASLGELAAATGWLPHTTRAALTGLRKKGHALTREKREDGTSIYRIVGPEV
jgi:DNA-binding MarR family transcriptional regulator